MSSYPDYEKMRRVEAERDELRHERDRLREALEDAFWQSMAPISMSEYQRIRSENERLREALKECEAEIDANIDLGTPASVHPKWDSDNAYLKANNPARLALQEAGDD